MIDGTLYPLPGTSDEALPTLLTDEALGEMLYFAARAPQGAVVEIGVYQGGSAWFLAQLGRTLYLYDTFEGHPETCAVEAEAHQVGRFADTDMDMVRRGIPSAHIIKGRFPDSLVAMPKIGFVHADVDTYQGTWAILSEMPKRMAKGGMILFDDYGEMDCAGCTKALKESGFPLLITPQGKALVIV